MSDSPAPVDTVGERPAWIPSGSGQVFAVLHTTAAPPRGATAVLMCPMFGWEEESAHRGLVTWARELAGAGYPSLRIDLPGTRNSTGGRDLRRLALWKTAIGDAAVWLRERAGAGRIVLLGIGLGGLVACDALLDGAPIDDLMLWAVPASGRLVMREMRMHARVIAARYPEDATEDDSPDAPVQAAGFALERVAVGEFEKVRLDDRVPSRAGERRALLLSRDDMAVDSALEAHLREAGLDVTVASGPGHATLTDHPERSRAPRETISETIRWLAAAEPHASRSGEPAAARGARVEAVTDFEHGGTVIRETALWLPGRETALFAVIAQPTQGEPADVCAVMLNSGSLSHVGPNRAWVEAARRWAASGVATVRLDFPGIGDTPGDGDRLIDTTLFYEDAFVEETLGVLDRLQDRGLPARFAICGLCSGAYWAAQAAQRDRRVVGALLLNLWAFAYSRQLAAERETGHSLSRLRGGGIGRLIRRGLLRRDLTRDELMSAFRSIAPSRMLAGSRGTGERAHRQQITAALDCLRDQGTETLLLFGSEEPTYDEMEREGVLSELSRWPQVTIERIPTRDHMWRAPQLQSLVHDHLDRAIERVVARPAAVSAS